MIQYVESLAQPEAEIQAPIQAVEQPVFPEAETEELQKEIEELKMQNRILINALQAGNCPQCGGPVPPPGVQQQPRVDVNPPQPEFLEVSSDDSIDQELLWGDIRDFMPTSTEHSLMLVPSEDLPGTCS
ncbi:hypothetical protein M0R45_026291 [Rubus argutus]|uniref:Uncharacterized protein n=1 Tax=Rubus argutus TaxID=59490 RepID=A0AAW1WYS2_RUBAR